MRKVIDFFRTEVYIPDEKFKFFFRWMFICSGIAYLNYAIPFAPDTLFGFNWTGIAWIVMLCIIFLVIFRIERPTFPFYFWAPWVIYMIGSVIASYSFVGLQLTFQYMIPILVGVIASSFSYSWPKIFWLFQQLSKLVVFIYVLFLAYYLTTGYAAHMPTTPMIFIVLGSICLGSYYVLKQKFYLFIFFILFIMPFVSVTRMALLVFLVTFVFHFSNSSIRNKIIYGFLGLGLGLIVFTSEGFQKKTFFEGDGELSEIGLDLYDNEQLNNNGRKAWQISLAPGLAANPIWGNGPRADNAVLKDIIGEGSAEAHNDYLSVTYNYGAFGLTLLLIGIISTFLLIFKNSFAQTNPLGKIIFGSVLTLFFGYMLFMATDNILKYTIFFPNYFYALIGITFSIHKKGWSYL
ncbi:O-antigen ligase family protein [Mongoliibacter ruber]|uniref:O-antigen ligase-like membrane protein n=1 Tax=Mongoliibacter ruber TaxID=1750599 RepID=A0A2T0WNX9_9BACT|nr:O-antigen ligase family protein [Mongoliibacter ruber]PRY88390.1 O-antigen ligase-like membrane protein [Mongoliibacter ruber]